MPSSSYQMERLLDRLRRYSAWLPWPNHRRWQGADRVRVSPAARPESAAVAPEVPAAPRAPDAAALRDGRRFAPVVEDERERRAGRFMQPPYPDEPTPSRLPRAGEGPSPRPRPRPVGSGD